MKLAEIKSFLFYIVFILILFYIIIIYFSKCLFYKIFIKIIYDCMVALYF